MQVPSPSSCVCQQVLRPSFRWPTQSWHLPTGAMPWWNQSSPVLPLSGGYSSLAQPAPTPALMWTGNVAVQPKLAYIPSWLSLVLVHVVDWSCLAFPQTPLTTCVNTCCSPVLILMLTSGTCGLAGAFSSVTIWKWIYVLLVVVTIQSYQFSVSHYPWVKAMFINSSEIWENLSENIDSLFVEEDNEKLKNTIWNWLGLCF